jgi:hypothetical protein
MPVIVRDVKPGAGRAVADRVIIGELVVAAAVTVVIKLSAAAPISGSMRFVFIGKFAFLLIGHRDGDESCWSKPIQE